MSREPQRIVLRRSRTRGARPERRTDGYAFRESRVHCRRSPQRVDAARLIMDAHPEIGCPGETGLPSLAARLEDVWAAICTDIAGEHVAKPPARVLTSMRRALRAPMDHYCQQTGKRIYCDKSLDAPDNLAALGRAFPHARYILLFRQVFDVVASGLEVSPYGFKAFGYAPFVQQSVDNFVAPLVHLWTTRVRSALKWEAANESRCHRVRYEDLVTDPTSTLAALFDFSGSLSISR